MSKNYYVITGGPGGGKSTLIMELKKQGYACVEEGARLIIQSQVKAGGDALPWANVARYKELLLAYAQESYAKVKQNKDQITFFDRGILDVFAYDRRTTSPHLTLLTEATCCLAYSKIVFVTPPWEEIFCNDNERKQTFEEAIEVYKGIIEIYRENDCHLVELPKVGVTERMHYLLNYINTITYTPTT